MWAGLDLPLIQTTVHKIDDSTLHIYSSFIQLFLIRDVWLQNLIVSSVTGDCAAGLPASHFSYVRNIQTGLPVFLFGYNDRTLHGIYEAASPGQMNIDPYAWTDGGRRKTKYPAQVNFVLRLSPSIFVLI